MSSRNRFEPWFGRPTLQEIFDMRFTVKYRLDQAIREYVAKSHEVVGDCNANNEGLYCCLDRGHPNYDARIEALTDGMLYR